MSKLKQRIERLERLLERLFPGELARTDAMIILGEELPEWREIVGAQGEDTEFRRWLKKQPLTYRERIETSDSPDEVKESIKKFETRLRVLG